MRQRNKRSRKCVESLDNDDEYILSRITEKFGCRPLHWALNTSLPKCLGKEIMKNVSKWTPHYYTAYPNPPCQRITHILGVHEQHDRLVSGNYDPYIKNMKGVFEVKMRFGDESFMLIKQTRDYDIQSLIGNAGGYLGLFLGCAILQIPQALKYTMEWINSWRLQ